jgi:hypothetical protein
MHELIKNALDNIKIAGAKIPVAYMRYTGKSETYITWQSLGENPAVVGDYENVTNIYEVDVDIYSNGNYLELMEVVKTRMKSNGFLWLTDSPDMYEVDTKLYHKTLSFEKERSV